MLSETTKQLHSFECWTPSSHSYHSSPGFSWIVRAGKDLLSCGIKLEYTPSLPIYHGSALRTSSVLEIYSRDHAFRHDYVSQVHP